MLCCIFFFGGALPEAAKERKIVNHSRSITSCHDICGSTLQQNDITYLPTQTHVCTYTQRISVHRKPSAGSFSIEIWVLGRVEVSVHKFDVADIRWDVVS